MNFKLDLKKKVFIIAEIGNNHEGSLENAKKMIDQAKKAGADCVKFQTIKPEELVVQSDLKRINLLKKFELKKDDFIELYKYAKKKKIFFISTPFYIDSIKWLSKKVCAFKVASGDFTFYPLIKKLFHYKKPIFISTGMATQSEIINFVNYFKNEIKNFKKPFCLMYCISDYPAKKENVNLNSIRFLSRYCDFAGYSDHTLGIDSAIESIYFGARIIEKHFTLNKNFSNFRDHQISLNFNEFKEMVKKIREIEKKLLFFGKKNSINEIENKKLYRRGIYAKKKIPKGKKVKIDDLTFLRPQKNGMSASKVDLLINKISLRTINKGELINIKMISN